MKNPLRLAVLVAAILVLGTALVRGPEAAPKKSKSKGPKPPAGDTTAVLAKVGDEVITQAMIQKRLEELPEPRPG